MSGQHQADRCPPARRSLAGVGPVVLLRGHRRCLDQRPRARDSSSGSKDNQAPRE